MATEQEAKMLNGGIASEFGRFVFPSVIGMLAISSASVVDAIFIGNYVGAIALASVLIVMPLLAFVFGVLIMISLGAAVVAGKYLGENNSNEASNIFSKAGVAAVLALSLLAVITLIVPDKIVRLLGAQNEIIELSAQYAWVMALFFPAFALAVVFTQFARVDGRPNISFIAMIGITLGNIVLDYVLIAWLDWSLTGAALATGLAYLAGALIPLIHFLSPRSKLKIIRPYGSWFVLLRSTFNGFSEFLNETSSGLVLLLFNWILMSELGANGVAAFAVADYLLYFGILIFYGVAEGVVPLISVNLGGRKPDRIGQFLALAIGFSTVIGTFLALSFLIWPDQLIGIFLQEVDPDISPLALNVIAVIWPVFIFAGANIAISAYFTGMHCAVQSSIIALMRSLILPIGLIFVFWNWFGVIGVFYALPIAEMLTFILCCILLYPRLPSKLIAPST
jgi:Na+-driven multidrug efflux pump